MTLPSSGSISIAQARDEYQLSNPVSMNQFIGKPNMQGGTPISFWDFYGKSNYADRQVVTLGSWNSGGVRVRWGFESGANGSISDGTSNVNGNRVIDSLHWGFEGTTDGPYVYFRLTTTTTNSGWDRLVINGNTFYRASALFQSSRVWRWNNISSNPFGTGAGVQVNVDFFT